MIDGFLPSEKNLAPAQPHPSRTVFGTPLEESLEVAQIANLPAIVFRCIKYLESKKAEQEEGIYRLSGSSAVIKSLKDRFNSGAFMLPMLSVESLNSGTTNSKRVTSTCWLRMSTGTRMPSQDCLRHLCVSSLRAS